MLSKLTKKSLTALLVVVYVVALAELYIRVVAPVPMLPRFIVSTDYGIRGNMPNQSTWHKTPDYNINLRTNGQGIRADRDISLEKPQGTKRIVVLGDSFGLGFGVNLEDSIASQLEQGLANAGSTVEVVNLSVSGLGNAEQLLKLKEEGLAYAPDLVLLIWHRSDINNNWNSRLFKLDAEGQLVRDRPQYLPAMELREYLFSFSAYRWLAQHSQLYTWLREFAAGKLKPFYRSLTKKDREEMTQQRRDEVNQKMQQLTLAILNEMQEASHQQGAKFLVFEVPDQDPSGAGYIANLSTFRGIAKQLSVLTPVDKFTGTEQSKLYWQRSHGHFTPKGCQVVSELLVEQIVQESLL